MGSCYFDSSPAVFITGQVNRHEQKGDRQIRQLGFQETDIVAMARPITKAAWLVQTPEEVPELLRRAFHLASAGRPGPVLLDIPMDVQRCDIKVPEAEAASDETADSTAYDEDLWRELFDQLSAAQRPLILIGGGIRSARATEQLRALVNKVQVPVVNSLLAVDVLPYDDPLRVGMIGSYGNRWANHALGRADFCWCSAADWMCDKPVQRLKRSKGDREIFHVDCEPGEINNRVVGCTQIVSHLLQFLNNALQLIEDRNLLDPKSGWRRLTICAALTRTLRNCRMLTASTRMS